MAKNAIARWSNPQVLLVATDLLEDHALMLHAIFQARLSRATVILVHVISPSYLATEVHGRAPFVLPSPAVRTVKAKLDEAAMEFQREGILCESIVLNGLLEEEIPLLVKSRSVDRVIVATRNTSGVARLIESSIAEKLIEVLEVPVCVIGRLTRTCPACSTPLARVLLATSLHSSSLMLAGFASALAEVNHAHLTLLHVLDSESMSEQQLELARLAARQKLSALVPNEARHRFQPLILIRVGDPATIILKEAGSLSQDIVILGAPRSSSASRLLSSCVVHRVILESQCPVITIKSTPASPADVIYEVASDEAMSPHR